MNTTGKIILTTLITGTVAVGAYQLVEDKLDRNSYNNDHKTIFLARSSGSGTPAGSTDFIAAAKAVTPAVVHIKTTYNSSSRSVNSLYDLFGNPEQESTPAMGSGSGISISPDGYIATNNHVIENASGIEVIFPDKRVFPAKLIGRDPNTDLALLKVNSKDLPVVKIGNSDNVEVGEWVLAVGYPFSLNTTVTAGIISAKGRSIGILNQPQRNGYGSGTPQPSSAIESFIQTDAAINPGNSGGALVNTNGELIGINAAIASQTGSYAGYGFAIPVNLASKILDDLMKFGKVKRGFLGVSFPTPLAEDEYLKQKGIKPGSVTGVFITDVQDQSAAETAGLREGDIIQSIDGVSINSSSEFSERIARHRPGDKVELIYLRNGKKQNTTATLKGEETADLLSKNNSSLKEIYKRLGATFSPVPDNVKRGYRIKSGVVVSEIISGGFLDQLGIPEGTIISVINGKPINTPKDIDDALSTAQDGRIQMLAISPDGSKIVFNFSMGA
jgi:serine protease Do